MTLSNICLSEEIFPTVGLLQSPNSQILFEIEVRVIMVSAEVVIRAETPKTLLRSGLVSQRESNFVGLISRHWNGNLPLPSEPRPNKLKEEKST